MRVGQYDMKPGLFGMRLGLLKSIEKTTCIILKNGIEING
jgi:hypothetical protein